MNALKTQLLGKIVVVFEGPTAIVTMRCTGGFGCNPATRGTAVFGDLINGEHCRIDGRDILRFATVEECDHYNAVRRGHESP